MDMQECMNAMMAKMNKDRLDACDQLTLGEIILKLEAVKDQSKSVIFDGGNFSPLASIDSWRGVYAELAIDYKVSDGEYTTVEMLLESLKEVVGSTLEGYKGGDFRMTKNTAVWIASCGSCGFCGNNGESSYIVEIKEKKDEVILVTGMDEEDE